MIIVVTFVAGVQIRQVLPGIRNALPDLRFNLILLAVTSPLVHRYISVSFRHRFPDFPAADCCHVHCRTDSARAGVMAGGAWIAAGSRVRTFQSGAPAAAGSWQPVGRRSQRPECHPAATRRPGGSTSHGNRRRARRHDGPHAPTLACRSAHGERLQPAVEGDGLSGRGHPHEGLAAVGCGWQ